MEAIFHRRSIRKYLGNAITDEKLKKILQAGMCAPSAGNQRSWQFIVVQDPQRLVLLSRTSPFAGMTASASLSIVVCGDLNLETHRGYWIQDCAAATENMLIMIDALDLGAVWLGIYPREDRVQNVREMFELPEHIIPFAIIPVGYPAEAKSPNDRFESEKVHYETW